MNDALKKLQDNAKCESLSYATAVERATSAKIQLEYLLRDVDTARHRSIAAIDALTNYVAKKPAIE